MLLGLYTSITITLGRNSGMKAKLISQP